MARMPGAVWQGEHGSRPMSRYDIVCVHTIVGYAPAHAAHFSVKGDGTILQSRDTRYRSGANLEGNHRVIAIENEDHGPNFPKWTGSNVPALTDAQVTANALILRWAHETHGIPLLLCPNSLPSSRGLAYHRQGCDGNFTDGWPGRVPGGETWTTSYGKVCPGTLRIGQRPEILQRAIGGPQPEEDDMTPAEANKVLVDAISIPGHPFRNELAAIIDSRVNRKFDDVLAGVARTAAADLLVATDIKGQWWRTDGRQRTLVSGRAYAEWLIAKGLVNANGLEPHVISRDEFDKLTEA